MRFHYRTHDKERPYFITTTVVDWIDVFIRKNHKECIADSPVYCPAGRDLNPDQPAGYYTKLFLIYYKS